jgi:HK97 family phage portal protein
MIVGSSGGLGGTGSLAVSPYATQPYNQVVWPTLTDLTGIPAPLVWDAATARRLPSVGRALGIYGGIVKQMPMDAYRGITPLPRPRLLEQPDPDRGRAWWQQVMIEDYLLHGNAIAFVTTRGPDGWPTSAVWLPAAWCALEWDPRDPAALRYTMRWDTTVTLNIDNIIHIRRGADTWCPARGVGVVEEHIRSLDRTAREEEYQRQSMNSGVPSVAVIAPNPRLSQTEAHTAGDEFWARYGGAGRRPGVFPAGTVITPIAWSPSDAQLVEARGASLVDVANMFNLDGFWLGAPSAAMTYKSSGPMFTDLLRVSVEPVLTDFEDILSGRLLPRGQRVVFGRSGVLRDDLGSMMGWLRSGVEGGLWTRDEARAYLDKPPLGGAVPQVGPLPLNVDTGDQGQLLDNDSAGDGNDPAPQQEGVPA